MIIFYKNLTHLSGFVFGGPNDPNFELFLKINISYLDFFSLFSAFFSFAVLAGAFLTFFFESFPFPIIFF